MNHPGAQDQEEDDLGGVQEANSVSWPRTVVPLTMGRPVQLPGWPGCQLPMRPLVPASEADETANRSLPHGLVLRIQELIMTGSPKDRAEDTVNTQGVLNICVIIIIVIITAYE